MRAPVVRGAPMNIHDAKDLWAKRYKAEYRRLRENGNSRAYADARATRLADAALSVQRDYPTTNYDHLANTGV